MASVTSVIATPESQTMFNLALEQMHRNHFREATRSLREALRMAPDNAHYLSFFGLCLARDTQDFDTAIRLCSRALEQIPHDTVLQVNLGKVFRLKGDNASAYNSFLGAWEENRRHPGPAAELTRMGIRRTPVIPFLSRSSWPNRLLGRLRTGIRRRRLARAD
jgi:Flp pilus assembly protein TadD